MRRCLIRISLACLLIVSSEVWALGLGEVRLDSALNEPLRAEIELLAASAEELAGLNVALASQETFARYGIDRPFYLQELTFEIVRSGTAEGNYVRVRSRSPITEPFLTFLVEATWPRGRLLREYTVLLDPPTFAPPVTQSQPAVTAPTRSAPADSGRIERQPPPPQPTTQAPTQPRPQPAQPPRTETRPVPSEPDSKPQPVADDTPYDSSAGGDYVVQRGETLWGIATAMRPDSRLTMNQTMLAIFEANPGAFAGNINILRAGARLTMPSADDIYQIDRGYALEEAQRQHAAWDSGYTPTVRPQPTIEPEPEQVVDTETQTTLELVPPDEEPTAVDTGIDTGDSEVPMTREQEIEARIAELEAMDVPIQQSLIEIRDNELAALRQELAQIRGEALPDDTFVYDEGDTASDELGDIMADDTVEDEAADATGTDDAATTTDTTAPPLVTVDTGPSIVDTIIEMVLKFWWAIAGGLLLIGALLFWFLRRGDDDDDIEDWGTREVGDMGDSLEGTESMPAPAHDESIVVVEQESGMRPLEEDTVEAPMPAPEPIGADPTEIQPPPEFDAPTADAAAEATGQFGSLEDTFSSETAVNLDQSDPIAEADFHMAYGLYDQAADLINGALEVEPERQDLLTKLCEIYFVWGNRDAFIDSAQKLKAAVGAGDSADWDKIVIMGQQIAADHELFAGAGVAGATKAVDLSFESDMDDGTGALDMEFGAEDSGDDIIDLGAETASAPAAESGLDFTLEDSGELEAPDASATAEQTGDFSVTSEMPTIESSMDENTVETPTIEEQFSGLDATNELPSISDDDLGDAIENAGQSSEATAEINLDELGLDVDSMAETELASLDDLDATGRNEALEITGKNEAVDPDSTSLNEALDVDTTGLNEALDPDLEADLAPAGDGMRLAADETGQNPLMDSIEDSQALEAPDETLLDATGHTQILSDDMAVSTIADDDEDATMLAPGMGGDDTLDVPSDAETMLASLDDDEDEDDFDFAKTEALPQEAFTGNDSLDETGELPAVASTDVELDLDDLTAALQVSEIGDTVEQPRDDKTVEQPRPQLDTDETSETMSLSQDDMSDDLHEARTMTEVGTKLDLARAYVDMGDPAGARSILEEVLDEGDESQRQQAQQLLDSLPA